MSYTKQRVPNPPTLAGLADTLSATQDAVADALRPLEASPIVGRGDGHIIERVALGATATDVAHLLQRPVRGWWLTRKRAAGDVYEDATQPDPNRFLRLVASAAVTVDLYVF